MLAQIIIKNLQKNKKIPVKAKKIKNIVSKVLKSCNIKNFAEINIYFVDNRKIKALNRRYLNKDYPTDVLAFDISKDKDRLYADIFVSLDMAISNAKLFRTSATYELFLYIIHGILHLLGFNDSNPQEQKAMREKENYFLNRFKLR